MINIKFKFSVLLLLFYWHLTVNAITVTVIGDSPSANNLADLLTVQFSKNKDTTVVERSLIEKILRERKLIKSALSANNLKLISRLAHVDLILSINSTRQDAKVVPSSMVLFNAKNGYKLFDTGLSGKIEDDIKSANLHFHNSINAMAESSKFVYVAILSTRTEEVPGKHKYRIDSIGSEISRRLVNIPDIALLERTRLCLVNSERKLTDDVYRLTSSSYLLDFEFTSNSDGNDVDLKLYILTPDEKKLKSLEYRNCLANHSLTVEKIMSDLTIFFKTPNTVSTASSSNEAKRFYLEYMFYKHQRKYSIAKNRLESAVALSPDIPDYRLEMINFYSVMAQRNLDYREYGFSDAVEYGGKMVELGDDLKRDFPDFKKPVYIEIGNFLQNAYRFWNGRNKLSNQQKQDIEKLADNARPKWLNEIKEKHLEFDLSDGIDSTNELNNFYYFQAESCMPMIYFNHNKSLARYFEALSESAAVLDKCDLNQSRFNKYGFKIRYETGKDFFRALTNQIKSDSALRAINAAQISRQKSLKACGIYLDFLRKSALTNYDEETFSKNLDIMFDRLQKLEMGEMTSDYYMGLYFFRFYNPNLYKIYVSKKKKLVSSSKSWSEFKKKHGIVQACYNIATSPEQRRKKLLKNSKTATELAKIILQNEKLFSLWRQCNTSNNSHHMPSTPSKFIHSTVSQLNASLHRSKNGQDKLLFKNAIEVLLKPFKIQQIYEFNPMLEGSICSILEHSSNLFLVAKKGRDLTIYRLSPNSSSPQKTGNYKELLPPRLFNSTSSVLASFVNDEYYIIGCADRIIVIQRSEDNVKNIENLPTAYVNYITMLNGRIYAFIGQRRKTNMLFSCLPDGSGRKIHISGLRRDKKNIFDKQKYFPLSGLFADNNKNRLIFLCGGKVNGLWAFYPEKDKFERLTNFNNNFIHSVWASKILNKIYYFISLNNFYIYDMETEKNNFILMASDNGSAKNKKHTPVYHRSINVHPPFFINKNWLWASTELSFTDMASQDGSYCMYGLNGKMYPHPDGRSVYLITKKRILKITPPDKFGSPDK